MITCLPCMCAPLLLAQHTFSNLHPQSKTMLLHTYMERAGLLDHSGLTRQPVQQLVMHPGQSTQVCSFATRHIHSECLLLYLCRGCLCIGCNTTATQAIRMAYFHTARLFASLEKKRTRGPDALKLVGARLARTLHAHICLLLDTQARQTANRSLLSQSQLCLQASGKTSICLMQPVVKSVYHRHLLVFCSVHAKSAG